MTLIVLSFVLLALAAICNAVMDVSDHHYHKSIFRRFDNRLWWDGEISWKNKYIDGDFNKGRVKWYFGLNKPVQITDAWHFFKMWMIIFICGAILSALFASFEPNWWNIPLLFLGYGVTWNVTFSTFYNRIFKTKG